MGKIFTLGLIVIAVIVGSIGYKMRTGANEKLVAAPAVNDKYIAELKTFVSSVPPSTYGVMKVVAVRGSQVDFAVSKSGYNKAKFADQDYDRGKTDAPDYYLPGTLTVPHAALQAAVKDNSIVYIRR